jgi:hypothetical protein
MLVKRMVNGNAIMDDSEDRFNQPSQTPKKFSVYEGID